MAWPAHPPLIEPMWRTATVVGLADAIRKSRAYDRLPILADALEDAGCDNLFVLNHCRAAVAHDRNCWVVSAVLRRPADPGRPPDPDFPPTPEVPPASPERLPIFRLLPDPLPPGPPRSLTDYLDRLNWWSELAMNCGALACIAFFVFLVAVLLCGWGVGLLWFVVNGFN